MVVGPAHGLPQISVLLKAAIMFLGKGTSLKVNGGDEEVEDLKIGNQLGKKVLGRKGGWTQNTDSESVQVAPGHAVQLGVQTWSPTLGVNPGSVTF